MQYHCHNQIRKYTVAFANLFSDIYIHRNDAYGTTQQQFRVPLTYASKSKMYMEIKQQRESHNRPISVLLPRITFILTGIQLDSTRKTNTVNRYRKVKTDDSDSIQYIFNPVPYNFQFSMNVWTKYSDDAHQIIEQILPLFQPAHNVSIIDFEPFEINRKIPIILEDVSYDLENELDESPGSVRKIMWNLSFLLKGFLYSIIHDSKVIKKVITNVRGFDPYSNDWDSNSLYYQETNEVYPYDSLEDEEWQVKKTVLEENNTTITYHDKPAAI